MAPLATETTQTHHQNRGSWTVTGQSRSAQANSAVARPALLADLLTEVGVAVEDLPGFRLRAATVPLAAIATELVEQAQDAGLTVPAADPAASLAATLRRLGMLAARTVGTPVEVDGASAARVRRLLAA